LYAFSELRAVLLAPVVVRGARAGDEIAALADLRVPDVGQVRHLRALADVGVLDLDERADLGVRAQLRARPEVGERADLGARAHLRLDDERVDDHGARLDGGVADGRVRTDLAPLADGRAALEHGARSDDAVVPDRDPRLHPRRARVEEGDTCTGVGLDDAALRDLLSFHQPDSIVDAHRSLRIVGLERSNRAPVASN